MKGAGGEMVQVQGGGHVIRPTGRKDRHSKVHTSKGQRDRRVRLAAHTAIQFYDVQDRLGYDRPSKALDWLIQKAGTAISELPPWNPGAAGNTAAPSPDSNPSSGDPAVDQQSETHSSEYHPFIHPDNVVDDSRVNHGGGGGSSFLQPYLSSMKTLFPLNSVNFPDFSDDGIIVPKDSPHLAEDLDLSLQSLHAENHGNVPIPNHNPLLPDGNIAGFQENFQRVDSWNDLHGDGNIGFLMNCEPAISQPEPYYFPGFPFSHRELLQSNLLLNHPADNRYQPPPPHRHQSSDSVGHFSLGFHVPAHQFYPHNDEEQHH